MNLYINNKLKLVFLLVACFVFVSACNGTKESSKEEIERKRLKVTMDSIAYDATNSKVEVDFTTNLPKGITWSQAYLRDPIGNLIGNYDGKEEPTPSKAVFNISETEKVDLVDGEYEFEIKVNVEYEGDNKDLLFDSEFGGFSDDMEEFYNDSETVSIEIEDYNKYSLSIKSEPKHLSTGISSENVEEVEEIDTSIDQSKMEAEYIKEMKDHAGLMGEQLKIFGELFLNPKPGDLDWKVDVSVSITEISRLSELPASFEVPDKYKETHEKYLNAMDLYFISMDMLPTALDDNDATQIEEAMYGMELAKGYLGDVFKTLSEANAY
ncbi:hypothetical protein [Rossellomorea sp. BNER]|uniref:hypothetical protein n=1 Tax=Rossellomorea sp. BNER TaxID=2962031 RepID=UPI003AF27B6E|nr:hypothetical protein [Rossellomorea sp. BNER]